MDDNDELAGLLSKARKRDRQAQGALLAQMRPWVRWQAQDLLGRRVYPDGSDIVQEVHIRALEHFTQFQGDSLPQLRAWIKTILRNIITDARRRHGDVEGDGGDRFSDLEADATTPSEGAIRNEQQARLAEALQRLPETQRLVFRLRCYEGLPFEEVARRAGVTMGNARVLMVRAIDKLRSELGETHD